jgi:hypothetical protein
MNDRHDSMGGSTLRVFSKLKTRAKPGCGGWTAEDGARGPSLRAGGGRAPCRRFRPLGEAMEGRALLSQFSVTAALAAPAVVASAGSHQSPAPAPSGGVLPMDTVVVNGQVELQPGE